jgi:hydroxyacylglutathione hydrolase
MTNKLAVLDCVAIPAFDDNYFWLLSDGHDAVVVDPGAAAPVEAYLREHDLRLSAILLTHHHRDHVGGVAELLSQRAIPVFGPKHEAIAHLTQRLEQGDCVELSAPRLSLRVLDVPGHTAGHIAYFMAAQDAQAPRVFCGDTMFACGCGRLFEGTPAQMLNSLDALAALPDQTRVHCAHEYTLSNIRFARAADPHNLDLQAWETEAQRLRAHGTPTVPTTLGHEKRVNPFLRAGVPQLQASLLQALGETAGEIRGNRLETFTVLRAWKDRFK